jgi:hypothetical protein
VNVFVCRKPVLNTSISKKVFPERTRESVLLQTWRRHWGTQTQLLSTSCWPSSCHTVLCFVSVENPPAVRSPNWKMIDTPIIRYVARSKPHLFAREAISTSVHAPFRTCKIVHPAWRIVVTIAEYNGWFGSLPIGSRVSLHERASVQADDFLCDSCARLDLAESSDGEVCQAACDLPV